MRTGFPTALLPVGWRAMMLRTSGSTARAFVSTSARATTQAVDELEQVRGQNVDSQQGADAESHGLAGQDNRRLAKYSISYNLGPQ